jgi:hypothetical protein
MCQAMMNALLMRLLLLLLKAVLRMLGIAFAFPPTAITTLHLIH